VGAAVGATGDFSSGAVEMSNSESRRGGLDTAHGHSERVMEPSKRFVGACQKMQLIAGNVATYEGAKELISLGIDGLKVGIGRAPSARREWSPVRVCRNLPPLWSCESAKGTEVAINCRRGHQVSGYISKALAAGHRA